MPGAPGRTVAVRGVKFWTPLTVTTTGNVIARRRFEGDLNGDHLLPVDVGHMVDGRVNAVELYGHIIATWIGSGPNPKVSGMTDPLIPGARPWRIRRATPPGEMKFGA